MVLYYASACCPTPCQRGQMGIYEENTFTLAWIPRNLCSFSSPTHHQSTHQTEFSHSLRFIHRPVTSQPFPHLRSLWYFPYWVNPLKGAKASVPEVGLLETLEWGWTLWLKRSSSSCNAHPPLDSLPIKRCPHRSTAAPASPGNFYGGEKDLSPAPRGGDESWQALLTVEAGEGGGTSRSAGSPMLRVPHPTTHLNYFIQLRNSSPAVRIRLILEI